MYGKTEQFNNKGNKMNDKLKQAIGKLKEIREVAETYGVVVISEGDSRVIDTVLAAFPHSRQMTAKEYIIKEYGEPWLKHDWSPGDVIDALEEYGKYCAMEFWGEELKRLTHFPFDKWWEEFQKRRQRNEQRVACLRSCGLLTINYIKK